MVFEELDLYKTKIDAFLNYELFNQNDEDMNNSQEEERSHNSSVSVTKKEFPSLFDKYNRITENLLSQIKLKENDVLSNNFSDFNVKYEIIEQF